MLSLQAAFNEAMTSRGLLLYIYLTAIGLLPGGSVYKRTYIQQGNHTYMTMTMMLLGSVCNFIFGEI
jgi:hypothetical protein